MPPDEPEKRKMRTICWMADEPLRDAAFATLAANGFAPKKRPKNNKGWYGLDVDHNGKQTAKVSEKIFSAGYPTRMRHDPA